MITGLNQAARPRLTGPEEEARVRRAAEREGRRNRRRRAREQAVQQLAQLPPKHLEGMSSDDEIPDQDNSALKEQKGKPVNNSALDYASSSTERRINF